MGYRYIKLTSSDIEILEEASKTSDKQHIRRKCDTILLSDRGYDITSLSNLYQVRTHTIRDWMNKWLSNGLNGFSIAVGRGRKAEIDSSDVPLVETIKSSIALNPQNLNTVCQELNQSNGMTLTKGKLIRFLKKS
jgi:transposase